MTNNGSTPHYAYLIVGGGMAAHAAIMGIRSIDPIGNIGLISFDSHPPYRRPPLSKGLWLGESLDTIWFPSEMPGVDLHLGRRVAKLDPSAHRVVGGRGDTYTYERLLLATGGAPRRLAFGDGNIHYFRTADDYQRLRALAEAGQRFLLIGAGFIGTELSASLAQHGKDVLLVFRHPMLSNRILPREVAAGLLERFASQGVRLRPNMNVVAVERRGGKVLVSMELVGGGGLQQELVDGVVAGIGLAPNIELGQEAGLALAFDQQAGLAVDEFLRTSQPEIYAAGDVAIFYNPALGRRLWSDHEDNALAMGGAAGRAMAHHRLGRVPEPYHYLPSFYSELFDLRYEAVGDVDARLQTLTNWDEPFVRGVSYYLAGGRVRGVLFWNRPGNLDAARSLIAEPGPLEPVDLREHFACLAE